MSNKNTIFVLTFMTYAAVHIMRMSYSFNKRNLAQRFGIGHLFLGFLDASIFIMLSIGTLFRYSILKEKKNTLICLQTAIPTVVAFSILPLISLFFNFESNTSPGLLTYLVMAISIGSFGFFQFAFFPAVLTIFSYHFNVKKQGNMVGIWSSKSNAGNIMGFFLSNFLVYQLHTKWQTTMLIGASTLLIISLLLYYFVEDVEDNSAQITTAQFFEFMKLKWSTFQFKLYILSFTFFKAILYSYQLWTPSFLADVGFQQYSGYVPMVFDISTLFGSYYMGRLYQNKTEDNPSSKLSLLKKYKYFVGSVIIVFISLCYIIMPHNILIYFLLGALMGFILGGIYNALENNEILSYTNNNPRNTDMFSTINIGLGSGMVGIFQMIIGVAMHMGQSKNTSNQQQRAITNALIYLIIAILGMVAMILTFLRSYYFQNQLNKSTELQLKLIEGGAKI